MQPIERIVFNLNSYDSKIHTDALGTKRQKLESCLYKITKVLLIISQIFICAPMGVHKLKKDIKRGDLLWHRVHVIWCAGIYAALTACVYDEYTNSKNELPTVQKPLYYSEYMVYLVHLLEIIWAIYKNREQFWNFKNFIIDFDVTLIELKLCSRINYCDLQRFVRCHLLLILIHFICTVIIGYFYNNGIFYSFLRTNTIYILPNIIIQISLIQYYALLFSIEKRSDSLYGLLEKLLNNANTLDIWVFRKQLHLIRSLYAKLEEFVRKVNDTFAYFIVLVYFGSFVNISFNFFLLYKYTNAFEVSYISWIAYSAAWICMHIGKMFLILYYNQNIQNKKQNASVLLSSFTHEHQAVEPTLRHFILQLMSDTRSNVICGVAALNMNLITSLLVAISSFFIFLVQYDITYEALTKTHISARPNLNLEYQKT